jgi:hypothetical protein
MAEKQRGGAQMVDVDAGHDREIVQEAMVLGEEQEKPEVATCKGRWRRLATEMEHSVPHAISDGSRRARKVDGREATRKDHAV